MKYPYYTDMLRIHIHPSRELCYIVYNHPVLVIDDFLDDLLIDPIRKGLDIDYLAGRMKELMETGTRPKKVLALFLSECSYYSDKETQKFKQTIATLRALYPVQYEKQRTNRMSGQQQYGRAAAKCSRILECPRNKMVENLSLIKVYNGLGACYAIILQFHKALGHYDKVYELGRSDTLLERICFLTIFAPELGVRGRYQSVFTSERKRT